MSPEYERLYDLSDGFLDSFDVRDGRLTIRIHTWDDKLAVFVADDVDHISYADVAHVSALVRIPSLDLEDRRGFGIEGDDLTTAISFRARSFTPDP